MYQYGLTAPGMKDTSIPNGVTMMTDEDKWDFMGNYPILQMPANQSTVDGETAFNNSTGDMLFDVTADPAQKNPLDDKQVIDQLSKRMSELLGEVDAPAETYERLGLAAV